MKVYDDQLTGMSWDGNKIIVRVDDSIHVSKALPIKPSDVFGFIIYPFPEQFPLK